MTEKAMAAIDVGTRIQSLRGLQVLLDSDLAAIYGVSTEAFNQAIKRNEARFPADFRFQLSPEELASLKSQFVTSSSEHGGRRRPLGLHRARCDHGASVLNSPRAVEMSVFVVRAFVHLRDFARTHAELGKQLATLERRVVAHDADLKQVFAALRRLLDSAEVSARRSASSPPRSPEAAPPAAGDMEAPRGAPRRGTCNRPKSAVRSTRNRPRAGTCPPAYLRQERPTASLCRSPRGSRSASPATPAAPGS